MRPLALASVLACLAAPALAQRRDAAPRPVVEGVSWKTQEALTRVVVRVSNPRGFERREVKLEGADVVKLFLDLGDAAVESAARGPFEIDDGRVGAVYVIRSNGRARAVIELMPETEYGAAVSRDRRGIVVLVRQRPRAPMGEPEAAHEAPSSGEPRFQLSGTFKEEAAYRLGGPGALTKVKSLLTLGATGRLASWLSYKASGRGYYDAVFALNRQYPRNVADDQRAEDELRDTYLDLSFGDFDARLGRQQIVWGEAVGSFVADIVNPKDFREFVLQDFDQLRVPQWAGQAEYSLGDTHLEGIFLPEAGLDRLPLPGSEFPIALPSVAGASVVIEGTKTPPTRMKNGEWGGRVSQLVGGWDLSGFYFRDWDHEPTPFRSISITPAGPVVTFTPTQERLTQAGGSFSKDVGPAVVRGEGVLDKHRFLPVSDPLSATGVKPKDTIDYLLGASFTPLEKLNATVQLIQRVIPHYEDDLFGEERLRTQAALWLKAELWDEKLEPEVMVVGNLKRDDWMIRPKIGLNVGGHWRFAVGADVFRGQPQGLFGQYQTRSRGYGELKLFF